MHQGHRTGNRRSVPLEHFHGMMARISRLKGGARPPGSARTPVRKGTRGAALQEKLDQIMN